MRSAAGEDGGWSSHSLPVKTKSRQEVVLGILIAFEIVLFSITGRNFLSLDNFFECIRLSAEIGLLALALTPVLITGGIDLSVGSMMGFCAIAFGAMWQDAHLPIGIALLLTVTLGLLGGALNAVLIAYLDVSPLIVTLGTYSLFRGLAEGLTGGARGYSGFPGGFLFVGQGYLGDVVPTQTIIFVVAIAAFWVLLHRSIIGRALYAIGHSAEGTRYAAVPVARRLAVVYLLSGLSAGIAAIVYVAHLGQAKSDAGTGYELIAITAVVLGGTSITGGSGTISGTLMGLAAIVLLQNGLRLSAWPAELAGISTGLLLILTIVLQRLLGRRHALADDTPQREPRRSSAARLAAKACIALVLIGLTGYWVHRRQSIRTAGAGDQHGKRRVTIGVMPKSKGDPYFISCRTGAEKAAADLDVDMIWDGPTELDAAKQNEVVEGWITRHVDAISVAVANAASISTVLRKARSQGIKVVAWDADAEPDARDYFINQATTQAIGFTLLDEAARVMHEKGEIAIITGALSAANQNLWISFIKERLAKYPNMKLVSIRPSDDDRDKAFSEAQTISKVYPDVQVMIVISAPAVPGAAEAVKQSGRKDLLVIGLSLPNLCKPYVHDGEIEAVVLWNTENLGYLAVGAPAALARGTFPAGNATFDAGPLGKLQIVGSEIILGAPMIFRKDNIDAFNF
jgi:rhamnose transport system substrate-binding protein